MISGKSTHELDPGCYDGDEVAYCTSGSRSSESAGVESLLPGEADAFFRVQCIRPSSGVTLDQSFSVLLVTDGSAALGGDDWDVELSRGDAVLVPYAAGECVLGGDAEIIRCMPPASGSAE